MIASSPAYEIVPCPVCGGVDLREITSREAVRAEVEALWEFHLRRLQPETPPERLVDRVAFSHPPPFRVVQCRVCGLVFRNPRERAFELAALYERDAPTREAMQVLHDTQVASYDAQAERLAGGQRRQRDRGRQLRRRLPRRRPRARLDLRGARRER